jgi:hypothetical protein
MEATLTCRIKSGLQLAPISVKYWVFRANKTAPRVITITFWTSFSHGLQVDVPVHPILQVLVLMCTHGPSCCTSGVIISFFCLGEGERFVFGKHGLVGKTSDYHGGSSPPLLNTD